MNELMSATKRAAPKLIVSWNLPRIAADLAAHLESLKRADDLLDTSIQSEEFLEPYGLSPDDDHWVTMVAWGKQCVDCGDTQDYYMVYDRIWKKAGLKPSQCCCCKCLSVRLGRPLKPDDFTCCLVNTWDRLQSVGNVAACVGARHRPELGPEVNQSLRRRSSGMERKNGESTHPNEQKNGDRPLAIIWGRAQAAAQKAGKITKFFWVQMNYCALVKYLQAGTLNCGHAFINESDIHIDYVIPPRHDQDWEQLHARNLYLCCGSCHETRGDKSFRDWLDEQEAARLSNLQSQEEPGRVELTTGKAR